MRARTGCLLVLAYVVVEIALAVLLARWIGWWWLLVGVVACLVVGLGLVRYSLTTTAQTFATAMTSLRSPGTAPAIDATPPDRADSGARPAPPAQTLLIVPAGFLIAIPGILTTIIGLALWLPPVRRRIAARIERAARRLNPPGPPPAQA